MGVCTSGFVPVPAGDLGVPLGEGRLLFDCLTVWAYALSAGGIALYRWLITFGGGEMSGACRQDPFS